MANQKLKWFGDKIADRLQKAARLGIQETMVSAVAQAKGNTAFTYRSGVAEQSIRIAQTAVTVGGTSYGIWGSVSNRYFKFLEFGTRFTRTRTSISKRLKMIRNRIRKPKRKDRLPWKGGSWAPTLRPAAHIIYPTLGEHIKKAYKELR